MHLAKPDINSVSAPWGHIAFRRGWFFYRVEFYPRSRFSFLGISGRPRAIKRFLFYKTANEFFINAADSITSEVTNAPR